MESVSSLPLDVTEATTEPAIRSFCRNAIEEHKRFEEVKQEVWSELPDSRTRCPLCNRSLTWRVVHAERNLFMWTCAKLDCPYPFSNVPLSSSSDSSNPPTSSLVYRLSTQPPLRPHRVRSRALEDEFNATDPDLLSLLINASDCLYKKDEENWNYYVRLRKKLASRKRKGDGASMSESEPEGEAGEVMAGGHGLRRCRVQKQAFGFHVEDG
ncbi:unnamed protein product [Cyprideis torosa]|uniref:Uncharacterized protein n=1 Tax=Cyprideis torosa TaxID=163714 RepID=A0A7R8WE53_9CRUS|nr:unnamed protein product [Cyprideis torosa]CAG0895422.1 unnamed protein product [Cyprideis torosa]